MTSQCLKTKADETLSRNTKPSINPAPCPTYCDRNLQPASEPSTLFCTISVIQDGATPKSQDTAVNHQPQHLKAVRLGRLTRGHAAPPPGDPRGASVRVSASRRFRVSTAPETKRGRAWPRPTPRPPTPPKASPLRRKPVCPRGRAPVSGSGPCGASPAAALGPRGSLAVAAAV